LVAESDANARKCRWQDRAVPPERRYPDGTTRKEPADWNCLLEMLGKSGYRGFAGLEYEENNPEKDVPRLAGELRTAVRKISA